MTKIIFIFLIIGFTSLMSSNTNYLGFWERCNGPYGGLVSDIITYDDNIVCATRAGLYKKQGSNTWEFLGLGDVSIREIIKNGPYIYAAGYNGCYRINIKKNDIVQLYSDQVQSVAAIDSIVFMGTGYYPGLYRSTDYGKTWKESKTGIDNFDIEKIFITKSKVVLASAAGTSGSGIFRSTDLGLTWKRIDANKYAWNFQGICQNNNTLYAFDYENYAKVYISTDDGLTWHKKGRPADHIYAIFANNEGLYTGTNDGIFESGNGGSYWAPINHGIANRHIFSLSGNDSIVYAGSFGGIFSTPNTLVWKNISQGLSNSRIHAIINVDNRLFAATHGIGIQYSDDNGVTWEKIKSNLRRKYIIDIIKIGNAIYIIASNDWLYPWYGAVYKSIDFGSTWFKINNGFDTSVLKKIVGNEKFLLVGTHFGLFRSSNGGKSWVKILNGLSDNINVSSVAVLDSTAIVINGSNHIYRSTDYGISWQSSSFSGLHNAKIIKVINNQYYIGSRWCQIYKSSDYGKTWSSISGIPYTNSTIQDFTGDGKYVFAATSNDGVLISKDDGKTWKFSTMNLDIKDVLALYYKDDLLLCGTDGGGIFKFNFTGTPLTFISPTFDIINKNRITFEWTKSDIADSYRFQLSNSPGFYHTIIDTILQNTTFEARNLMYNSEYYYRVSTVNEAWNNDFIPAKTIRIDLPLKVQLDQNYPNPFNSYTTINYHIPEEGTIKLILYDLTGRKVSTLINSTKEAGSHSYIFQTTALASGIYYYQIRYKNNIVTKKFILIK